MFHADRWDYIFYFKRGSTSVVQQRDFTVNFASDRVTSWSGGENLPSNLELLAEIDGDKGVKVAAVTPPATTAAAPASGTALGTTPAVTAPSAEQPSIQPNASARILGRSEPAGGAGRQPCDGCRAGADRPHAVRRCERTCRRRQARRRASATGGNSQIQLKRQPQQINIPDSSAVGPQGSSPLPANANPGGGQSQFSLPPQGAPSN